MIIKLTNKGKEANERYHEYCDAILAAKAKGEEFFDHDTHDSDDDVAEVADACFTPLGQLFEDLNHADAISDDEFEIEEGDCVCDLNQMKTEGYIEF